MKLLNIFDINNNIIKNITFSNTFTNIMIRK